MPTTRLSGNELYCLAQKGYQAGNLIFGNSVYSLGAIQSLSASIRTTLGSELVQASQAVQEARQKTYQRMLEMVKTPDQASFCGISNHLFAYPDYFEFVSKGSLIQAVKKKQPSFSTAANGQGLYAQLDAGYEPRSFVLGTVVYASGASQSLLSSAKAFSRGEVKELSATFQKSKNQALKRVIKQAKEKKANVLLGLELGIFPFGKACEFLITGSACYNPQLTSLAKEDILSSGLSDTDLWNAAKLGYVPLQLVLATSIYSLGMVGNMVSSLKAFFRGEDLALTQMMHEARMKTLAKLEQQAKALQADEIMGVKTYVYSLGNGLMEFFALGTAMKKLPEVKIASEQLPPQVFSPYESPFYNTLGNQTKGSPLIALLKLLTFIGLIGFFIWLRFKN